MEEEQVFLQLTILLTVAVASHFIIRRFGQPTIVGEIAIGIVLGPSVVGYIVNGWRPPDPGFQGFFDPALVAIFAGLGAIFLLFLIGLEVDISAIYRRRNIYIAAGGVVLPWVLGFLTAYLMVPDASLVGGASQTARFAMATFVGATLVATSTAIASAILLELKMVRTEVAYTIMGAAVVDDILGLMVLSLSMGVARGYVDVPGVLVILATAVVFIVVMIYVGTKFLSRLVLWANAKGSKMGLTHTGFTLAMAIALFAAFLAEVIGLAAIIGAFLVGTVLAIDPLKEDFHSGVEFLGAIFTPIFFISLGMMVNIWAIRPELIIFGVVLIVVAFLTKYYGCGLPARRLGLSKDASKAVGYGMAPRGEVGLIIALAAQQAGVIGQDIFSVIVIAMVVVSIVPAPLLRKHLMRMERNSQTDTN